jgi:hypothetical protein
MLVVLEGQDDASRSNDRVISSLLSWLHVLLEFFSIDEWGSANIESGHRKVQRHAQD